MTVSGNLKQLLILHCCQTPSGKSIVRCSKWCKDKENEEHPNKGKSLAAPKKLK